MKTKNFQALAFLFLISFANTSFSQGFRGFYDPANWVEDDPFNRANMNISNAPDSIVWTINHRNSSTSWGGISYTIIIGNCATSLTFDWSSLNVSPIDAYFSYSINGVTTLLTDLDGSGTMAAIPVNPGDQFSFICSQWGCSCYGSYSPEFQPKLTISNFNVSISEAVPSPPVPDETVLLDVLSECSVTLIPPTATDDCSGIIEGTPDVVFPITEQGTTVVTWTFDDGYGYTSTQTQNVIIQDQTPPEIQSCASDINVNSGDTICGATLNKTSIYDITLSEMSGSYVITSDGCYPGIAQVYFNNVVEFSWTDTGSVMPSSISVEYYEGYNDAGLVLNSTLNGIADGSYNSGSSPFSINAQQCNPVSSYQILYTENYNVGGVNTVMIELPGSSVVGLYEEPSAQVYARVSVFYDGQFDLGEPYFTDNCDGTIVTNNAPEFFPIGTTIVTWTATDSGGNTATCDQLITVSDVAPVPDVAVLPEVIGECSVTNFTPPTARDNCAGTITGTTSTIFPITAEGSTVVTWSYDDGSGNVSTQTQSVFIQDVNAPVPDQAALPVIHEECSMNSLVAPTATDNCGAIITGATTQLPLTTQGTHVVTWTFDDGKGNTSTQTQQVVIDDVTAPIPDVATLLDVTGECSINTVLPPTATDNCGEIIIGTTTTQLPITTQGTHVVTWTFDDGKGNSSTQTQQVIIDDVTAPVPDVTTLLEITGECSVNTMSPPTATDNCGAIITGTTTTLLPITTQGTHVVTWTFDDGKGNSSTQTQQVVIDDVTAPEIPALSTIIVECSVTPIAPSSQDNCAGTITGWTSTPLPIITQGIHLVTWTFDDGNGNSSTVTQTVIVNDFTEPETPVLENITADCAVSLNAPATFDNCTGTVTGTTSTVFPITAPGNTIVVWTFDDGNGNHIHVNQTVLITPIDVSVVMNAGTLSAINSGPDVTYQWVDCNNANAPILGENGASFTPTQSGSYAVEISQNGCTEISICSEITVMALNELKNAREMIVYPNPASKEFFIDLHEFGILTLHDMNGKVVLTSQGFVGKNTVSVDSIETGIYVLQFKSENSFKRIKLTIARE